MKQVVNQLSCSKRSKESLRVILEEQLELNHSKVICDDLVELQNYPRGVKQEKDIDDKKKKMLKIVRDISSSLSHFTCF